MKIHKYPFGYPPRFSTLDNAIQYMDCIKNGVTPDFNLQVATFIKKEDGKIYVSHEYIEARYELGLISEIEKP